MPEGKCADVIVPYCGIKNINTKNVDNDAQFAMEKNGNLENGMFVLMFSGVPIGMVMYTSIVELQLGVTELEDSFKSQNKVRYSGPSAPFK